MRPPRPMQAVHEEPMRQLKPPPVFTVRIQAEPGIDGPKTLTRLLRWCRVNGLTCSAPWRETKGEDTR